MTASGEHQQLSLTDSLREYAAAFPVEERADALHRLFYGFYARIAILDRTTHELAAWAKRDITQIGDLPPVLAEALRDNALHVGQSLFATRMQTMQAMRIVSAQLEKLTSADAHPRFTLERAVAFDEGSGKLRTYDLSRPGEHPDLPYDPLAYDPAAEAKPA